MDRRSFLASASAATLASAASTPAVAQTAPAPTAATPEDQRLRALLDRIFYDRLADNPEQATSLGLDTGERAGLRSKLTEASAAARARDAARTRRERADLRRIDRARLSPMARIDHDVVEYQLTRAIEGERFAYGQSGSRYAPYVLSQLTGAYRDVPDFLDGDHPVRTAADAEAYLARLAQFPKVMDDEREQQRADAAKGVFAPDYILDTTLRQLATLREAAPPDNVLVATLRRKLAAAGLADSYTARAAALVEKDVYPALDRQRALVTELRAKAVHDAGCWRLPDGDAYYAAAAEAATTAKLTGDEIHRIGTEQVAEITAGIDRILSAQGMTQGTVGERLTALNAKPDQVYPNTDPGRDELVAQLNRQIKAMYARLPDAFHFIPKTDVVARRVPPQIQAGAPGGYYQSAPIDASRPATYFINLRDTYDRPKFGLATLTYHEAVPGHHLQVSSALESGDIPLIRRRAFFSGYGEGWALYAEQLADEMGMYDGDPLGRVGYLQSLLFRATRLVVDSGMHAKRWSREEATHYFMATTGIARGRSQGEIDRYTVWPGQACSYKIGHTMWVKLREETKARQGQRFDLKAFHDVLMLGAMPLTVLERTVNERMA